MAGRSIYVLKAFNLLLNEVEMAEAEATSNLIHFGIGRHDNVPDVIAKHPQVKANTGDDSQLASVMTAPTPPTGDMVPLADLTAAQAEAADLREQVANLQARSALHASMVETLQGQLREAGDARAQSEAALVEATESIRSLASRLNLPPESVMPPALAARPANAADGVSTAEAAPETAAPSGEAPPAPAADGAGPVVEAPILTPPAAVAPDVQTPGNPEGQTSGTPPATDPAAPAVTVQHKGAGRYAVFRGEEQVSEPTTREEAEAQAAALTAPAPAPAAGIDTFN
jgi:hypothetical protein